MARQRRTAGERLWEIIEPLQGAAFVSSSIGASDDPAEVIACAEAALQAMRKPAEQDAGVLARLAHTAQQVIGASDNHIIQAIYVTGREITTRAEDATSRDLGIISTGQLALHYYIAAFGSLASYADALGEENVAGTMKRCAEEAKAEDQRHTDLARKILAA